MQRRVVAEVRFGPDRGAVLVQGGRTIYEHWQALESGFGGVFLPPRWSPSDGRVSWSWEPRGDGAPTEDELAAIRVRLAEAGRARVGAAEPVASDLPTVLSRMARIARALESMEDGRLAGDRRAHV